MAEQTKATEQDRVRPIDVSPEQANYLTVKAFADGHGPILNKEDQHVALKSAQGHGKSTEHLTSNEELLQQLRKDVRDFEKKAPESLKGLESPRDYSERQRKVDGIVFCAASFCDPALLDRPEMQKEADAAGIPHINFQFHENTGQFKIIKEQAGTFSDSIKLWA